MKLQSIGFTIQFMQSNPSKMYTTIECTVTLHGLIIDDKPTFNKHTDKVFKNAN